MEIAEFYIDDAYLVRTSGTSDGTQDKYFKDNLWFKADRFGGEGLAEAAASRILKSSGFDSSKYVEYTPCLINGKQGCFSRNFLNNEDSFITLYRLYKNVTGRDLAEVCSRMDFDDAISKVFSPSFNINARYLKNYCTLHITKNCLNDIKNIATDGILNILNYTLGDK